MVWQWRKNGKHYIDTSIMYYFNEEKFLTEFRDETNVFTEFVCSLIAAQDLPWLASITDLSVA